MIAANRSLAAVLGALALAGVGLSACTPTIRVDVKPITIYAKLDADVRLRLDEEVKALIQQNPNLF
ncbi:YnbE family lipoprotein [Phenylobacterium sp.]|uniref:YnbE family lipoprotein n=1 Tax=Phenylobacterium sp. TaxID=1871053 RepID=UPI002FE15241